MPHPWSTSIMCSLCCPYMTFLTTREKRRAIHMRATDHFRSRKHFLKSKIRRSVENRSENGAAKCRRSLSVGTEIFIAGYLTLTAPVVTLAYILLRGASTDCFDRIVSAKCKS